MFLGVYATSQSRESFSETFYYFKTVQKNMFVFA